MGSDERGVPATNEPSEVGRRWLLGLAGFGGAAAVLAAAKPAAAGHEPGDGALHIGEVNSAPAGVSTFLGGDSANAVLQLHNENTADPAMALFAFTHGVKAIIGASDSTHEFGGVGVEGVSNTETGGYGLGAGTGVQGISGTGAGVRGASQSDEPNGFGRGPGTGVLGESGPGIGVVGATSVAGDEGFGVGDGIGVQALAGSGTAVQALATTGRAIEAHGRAAFSTAGTGTIPKGARQQAVETTAVTDGSHVSVTLTSDPRGLLIEWVERQVGSGFTIRLNAAAKRDTDFSYLVVEPT